MNSRIKNIYIYEYLIFKLNNNSKNFRDYKSKVKSGGGLIEKIIILVDKTTYHMINISDESFYILMELNYLILKKF